MCSNWPQQLELQEPTGVTCPRNSSSAASFPFSLPASLALLPGVSSGINLALESLSQGVLLGQRNLRDT